MSDSFEYTVGDHTLVLPLLRGPHMTMGLARKTRGLAIIEATFVIAEHFLTPEQLDIFDEIPQDQFGDFIQGWREASGVSVGESTAS